MTAMQDAGLPVGGPYNAGPPMLIWTPSVWPQNQISVNLAEIKNFT